jgi:threonine/homoserine/homoserine lactone efflux protein
MTADQAIAYMTFALIGAVTPGPSNVMISATGSAVGFVRGLPCALGAAIGMASLLFGAALGLGQIVVAQPMLLNAMNVAGSAFMLWLAWKIATAGPSSETQPARPVGLIGAAVFQWANPKGWLVAVSPTFSTRVPKRQFSGILRRKGESDQCVGLRNRV